MNCSAAHLDGDDGIQQANGCLKRSEERVFVGEDPEVARVDPYTDACRNVFFRGFEPSITLGLSTLSLNCDSGNKQEHLPS